MTAKPAKRYAVIDRIIAAEIYLYIVFMFLTKGEAVRNILLFSAFILWLSTITYRKNLGILTHPVSLMLGIFFSSAFISSIFSIDPVSSFRSLRGDPLKSVVLFCMVSTVFSDEARLRRFAGLTFAILLFTLVTGYYSYFEYGTRIMRPLTSIRHVWHNRFAMDINTLLPFSGVLFLTTRDMKLKIVFFMTAIFSLLAIILSTSRGGIAVFISICIIWSVYLSGRHGVKMKVILAGVIVIAALFAGIMFFSHDVKEKFARVSTDIQTLTKRVSIWRPLISAASDRPFFGWGYGPDIFILDKPFENTPYKVAPVKHKSAFRNPHNSFLQIFFHQGIAGLIPYVILLGIAVKKFTGAVGHGDDFQSHMLMAGTSIIIGIYIINSVVENPSLTGMSLILGIGVAADGLIRFKDTKMIQ